MPKILFLLVGLLGSPWLIAQELLPCQPTFDMTQVELKRNVVACPELRKVLQDNSTKQIIILLKDGHIVTYSFHSDALYSVESLWTFQNRQSAEDLFYKIYDRLLNDNATPLEYIETVNEIRLVAETEDRRYSLYIQDLLYPFVVVTLLITQA